MLNFSLKYCITLILICGGAVAASGASILSGPLESGPHKWRVNDPDLAKTLIANGGKLVADYGSFQLIQADDPALTNLDSSRNRVWRITCTEPVRYLLIGMEADMRPLGT